MWGLLLGKEWVFFLCVFSSRFSTSNVYIFFERDFCRFFRMSECGLLIPVEILFILFQRYFTMVSLDDFCEEILLHVFSFLDKADVIVMCDVSQKFRKIGMDSSLGLGNSFAVLDIYDEGDHFADSTTGRNRVRGFRLILRYIRIFQSEIKVISFHNCRGKQKCAVIIFYYINFFLKKLDELILGFTHYDISMFPLIPFNSVRCLRLIDTTIEGKLDNLPDLFPNVEVVEIDCYDSLVNKPYFFGYYPRLREMYIMGAKMTVSQFDRLRYNNDHANKIRFDGVFLPENLNESIPMINWSGSEDESEYEDKNPLVFHSTDSESEDEDIPFWGEV